MPTDTATTIARINGVALNAADEKLSAEELRQRACSELLRQAALAAGLLPASDVASGDGVLSESASSAIETLLEQLIVARDARRERGLPDVVLEHVRGHRGHVLNEWADERAVRGAEHAAKGTASAWSSLGGLHEKLDVSEAPKKKR